LRSSTHRYARTSSGSARLIHSISGQRKVMRSFM
jgi:hypothetical protein